MKLAACVCAGGEHGQAGPWGLGPGTPCAPPPRGLGNAQPQILPLRWAIQSPSPIKSSHPQMTFPKCVLEPPSLPRAFCLGVGGCLEGEGLDWASPFPRR